MRYVMGLDGSKAALYDADTGRLDLMPYGGEAGEWTFRALFSRNNIGFPDIELCVAGVPGGRHGALRGFGAPVSFYDEAYLSVFAGSSGGAGVCSLGGSCVAGTDLFGTFVKIGGLGELTGDFGDDKTLVRKAVGLVYSQLFRGTPYTALTANFFRWLDITDPDEFIPLITELSDQAAERLLTLLFETAAEGDAAALGLLEEAGRISAGGIAGAVSRLSFPPGEPLEIIFAGQIFVNSLCDAAKRTAEAVLLQTYRSPVFRKLDVPPVAGALVRALCEAGIPEQRGNVLRHFRSGVIAIPS
ncbi:MAG: hypothetical protein LBR72_04360 [Oscillospiraceae bacterium]|jgi:N-acetylglucosamine kinase-like BadF-type ATPase|nr:hypothetical protein [Oscillospiraceae bacterium]